MDSPIFFPTRIGERASANHAHCISNIYNHYILDILLNTLNMKQRLDDMTIIASM